MFHSIEIEALCEPLVAFPFLRRDLIQVSPMIILLDTTLGTASLYCFPVLAVLMMSNSSVLQSPMFRKPPSPKTTACDFADSPGSDFLSTLIL